jgi:hypothetical protein
MTFRVWFIYSYLVHACAPPPSAAATGRPAQTVFLPQTQVFFLVYTPFWIGTVLQYFWCGSTLAMHYYTISVSDLQDDNFF